PPPASPASGAAPPPSERPRGDAGMGEYAPDPGQEGGRTGGDIPGVRNVATTPEDGDATDHAESKKQKDERGGEGPLMARADFRSSIWWSPTVRVGADGSADIGPVKFAESLTRWRITARAVDASTRVGSSVTTVRTAKKLLTRVTLPRFLRVGDTALAPWVLHSLLEADAEANYVVGATGLT